MLQARTRLAVAVLTLVLLIPIAQAWIGGRTHLVSCTRPVRTPFQVLVVDGVPVVTSSSRLLPGGAADTCGGLQVDLAVGTGRQAPGVVMSVRLSNPTPFPWRGSVDLEVAGVSIPVDVGSVPPATEVERQVPLHVEEGTTEVSGSLVVGP